jgi:ComF family protein
MPNFSSTGVYAKLTQLARDLLGLVYPSKCLICSARQCSEMTPLLCEDCLLMIATRPLPSDGGVIELKGQVSLTLLDEAYAGWHYDTSMQLLIHAIKYRRRPSLSRLLGSMLAQRLREFLQNEMARAVLVPVPLHRRRERERGFNQSLLLAQALAKVWSLTILPGALKRVRFTQQQAKLDATARWQNVEGAFAPASNFGLETRAIFLIDDVFTTGATMNACAAALKSAGAARVIGIALAKA